MARPPGHRDRLPRAVAVVVRALLPFAERDEVIGDLEVEYGRRCATEGRAAARRWLWREALGSLPALLRRSWWRGMTGFEPRANQMRPGGPMLESWIMDGRFAARRLTKRPLYAALAICTLALGAGGTAAIFSVIRTLLLQPLPIAQEQQVGVFWFGGSWREAEFLHFRPEFPGFQRVAAYRPDNATLELAGGPLQLIEGIATSAEFFDVLRASPMLGRTFQAGDDVIGARPTSVLSYGLWQELGSDPAIVGRVLNLGGERRTVIGVMPRTFWYPSPTTQIWNSTGFDPQDLSGRYTLIGRIPEGASIRQMEDPLRAITTALAARFTYSSQWDKTRAPAITPVREFLMGDVSPSLQATFAAMAVILLMACANVSALLLGQVDAQATDLAIRAALGADRRRLLQQVVAESLLIGAAAGAMGAALAAGGLSLLVRSLPLGDLAEGIRLDWTVFWASATTAMVAAGLVALVPGVALWQRNLRGTMASARTGGVARRGGRLEGGLVVAQIALAVLLTAGAGLLIRSVLHLRAIDAGMDVRNVAVIDAVMPTTGDGDQRRRAILNALETLQSLPGAVHAAASQKIPLRGSGHNWGLSIKGKPPIDGTTAFRTVSRDYFRALGMRVVQGRDFEPSDRAGAERVVVINDALAAKFFPGEDPIGQVIQTFDEAGERVVGIVGNVAEANLTDVPGPARYVLYEQLGGPGVMPEITFVVRAGSAQQMPMLMDMARTTLRRDGQPFAVRQVTTMEATLELALGATGRVVILLSLLAGLALVLGAVGIYGVISHHVTRRSRDYAIRLALGETPARVVRQILGRGLALMALGGALGIAAAVVLTKLLSALLYGVEATDPLSLAGAVTLLVAVGMLAAFVPARRASLTDPAVALRQA